MKNELIVKHNKLIEANFKLTLQEQKIIFILVSKIKKDEGNFKKYTFSVKELAEILGLNPNAYYSELKEITANLISRVLKIKENKGFLQVSWLSSAMYLEDLGLVELSFSEDLKPYLLQLGEHFTKLELKQLINLNSFYAIRVYELLKQYEKLKERIIQIDELKNILEISTGYELYSNLKIKVLEIAKREINQKTDLSIDYEEIKTVRKVTAIKFLINKKQETKQIEFKNFETEETNFKNNYLEKLLNLLPNTEPLDIWKQKLSEALKKHSFEMLKEDLIYTVKHKPVNLLNYFEKSIKNGHYSAYEAVKKKSKEQAKQRKLEKELKIKQEKEKSEQELNKKILDKYNNLNAIELKYFENEYNLLPENVKNSVSKEFLIKAMIKEFFDKNKF